KLTLPSPSFPRPRPSTVLPSVCGTPSTYRLRFAIDFPDLERNDPRTENRDRLLGRRRRLHALPDPLGRLRDRLLPRPLRLAELAAPRRVSTPWGGAGGVSRSGCGGPRPRSTRPAPAGPRSRPRPE